MSVLPGFGGIPFPVPPYQFNHIYTASVANTSIWEHEFVALNDAFDFISTCLSWSKLNAAHTARSRCFKLSTALRNKYWYSAAIPLSICIPATKRCCQCSTTTRHTKVVSFNFTSFFAASSKLLATSVLVYSDRFTSAAYGLQLLQPNSIPVTLVSQSDSTNTDTLLRSTMTYPNVIPQSHPHSQPSIARGDDHSVQPLNNIRTTSENSSISVVD